MGLTDKIKETLFGTKKTVEPEEPAIEICHLGLTVGMHGKKLGDADQRTRDYIDRLVTACDRNSFFLHRLNLTDKPLKLVIVGRDYNTHNHDAYNIMKEISTDEDLLLSSEIKDEIIDYRLPSKKRSFNGIRSDYLTPKGDYEILGLYGRPFTQQKFSEQSDYIANSMLHFVGLKEFDKVYQHSYYERAILSYGRVHGVGKVTDNKVATTYDRTLVSAAEKAGLSYAVIMPKRFFFFGNNPERSLPLYKDHLVKSAPVEFSDVEKLLEK